jgi:replication factor A1
MIISNTGSGNPSTTGAMMEDNYKTLAQIKDENLGHGEKPSYFTTKATITTMKYQDTPFAYPACPTPSCNKKVNEMGPGCFYCEKCQKEYPKCDYRYLLNIGVSDHTTTTWLSCFNDTAMLMVGHAADEVMRWKQDGDIDRFAACFTTATYKTYHLKVRAKQESYQGEMKVRCQVISATPIDYIHDSKVLISNIRKLL